eukprot:3068273-Pleurochrysis_carterae.AAC.2
MGRASRKAVVGDEGLETRLRHASFEANSQLASWSHAGLCARGQSARRGTTTLVRAHLFS